jgi:hypothetical protein
MFAGMDSVLVVGTMWVLSVHEMTMAGRIYQALTQIMDNIAKGKTVRPEDWEIVWHWMQMVEAQVIE